MTTSQFDDDRPDGEVLASFVFRVCDDLNTVAWMRGFLFASDPFEEEQVTAAMRAAWEQVRVFVPDLVGRVRAPPPGDDRLVNAGLAGAQLRFKIAAWRYSRTGLLLAFADGDDIGALIYPHEPDPLPAVAPPLIVPDPALPPRRPRWMKWALKRLSQTLGHADTLLESLASVVNLAEPIKEYKKTVEKLANDRADSLPDGPSQPSP